MVPRYICGARVWGPPVPDERHAASLITDEDIGRPADPQGRGRRRGSPLGVPALASALAAAPDGGETAMTHSAGTQPRQVLSILCRSRPPPQRLLASGFPADTPTPLPVRAEPRCRPVDAEYSRCHHHLAAEREVAPSHRARGVAPAIHLPPGVAPAEPHAAPRRGVAPTSVAPPE